MIDTSMTPRNVAGLPNSLPLATTVFAAAQQSLSGPTFTGTNPAPDPINGREWTTEHRRALAPGSRPPVRLHLPAPPREPA